MFPYFKFLCKLLNIDTIMHEKIIAKGINIASLGNIKLLNIDDKY